LAESLKLSISTVSRVLNGKAEEFRISEDTQKRVLKAAQDYRYTPNSLARGLKLDKTDTIGLIIPDIANPFFADIAKRIEQEARSKGYFIILCDSGENQEEEVKLLHLLESRKVDGILIAPVGLRFDHLVELYESGYPVVIIDRYFPAVRLPYITTDNFQGGFDAARHLISNGHKRIACIQGIPGSQPNRDRINGYLEALKKNRIPVEEDLIVGDSFSEENGYVQTRLLFSLKKTPTAIFALSNLISLGIIKAAMEMELKIPEDFSLVSFDEQPYSAYLGTPMTTIEQQKSEIGRLAVNVLLRYIQGGENGNPISIMLKSILNERKSVKKIL
jgi:LacI family transcriptional regulator